MNKTQPLPTDAAIDTLILEHGVMDQAWPTQRQLHALARAVLAKWGTPAPVGGGASGLPLAARRNGPHAHRSAGHDR